MDDKYWVGKDLVGDKDQVKENQVDNKKRVGKDKVSNNHVDNHGKDKRSGTEVYQTWCGRVEAIADTASTAGLRCCGKGKSSRADTLTQGEWGRVEAIMDDAGGYETRRTTRRGSDGQQGKRGGVY